MTSSSWADFPLTRGEPSDTAPLSYEQQRLWFLHELNGGSPEYHIPEAFRLRGELDVAALTHSIQAIVERHEILRTRFRMIDGEPAAVVVPAAPVAVPLVDLRPLPEPASDEVVTSALAGEWELPFDLENGPLLRARLLRLADSDHALILTTHHIVSDGWSQAILHSELETLYRGFREGRAVSLPPPAIQYADFARWQRRRTNGGAADDDLEYWRHQLAGLAGVLNLAADRPRAVAARSPVTMCRLVIAGGPLEGLRRISRANGATLYMTMLAAFAVLLSRYSGQHDIAVGSPIAGRNKAELEGLVGFLVNTLVMRIGVPDDGRFADYLNAVRQTMLQAYEHQDAPFERVVQELSPERRLDTSPLFQAMFVLQAMQAATTLRLAGLAVEPVELTRACTAVDLELYAWEYPDQVRLAWVYDKNLFDAWRIEQMAGHYVRLLEQVSGDPGIDLARLELLTEAERQWLAGQHGPVSELPAGNVYDLFARQAASSPAAAAVRQDGRQVSYAELELRAGRLARRLVALGAAPGIRVGIGMEPGIEFIAAMLAALRCGASYLPLPVGHPPELLAFLIRDSGVELLLTSAAVAERLPAVARPVTVLVDPAPEGTVTEDSEPERDVAPGAAPPGTSSRDASAQASVPSVAACLVYAPDPAGTASGVEITHAALWNELTWAAGQFGLGPGDRVLQRLPAESAAAAVEMLAPLTAGAELAVARPVGAQDVQYLLDFIRREEITVVHLPPSVLRRIVRHGGLRGCGSLRCVISGGEVLPEALRREFAENSGARLWNTYGAAETTAYCTCYDGSRASAGSAGSGSAGAGSASAGSASAGSASAGSASADSAGSGSAGAGSAGAGAGVPIGRPAANTAVLVLDERMRLVPKGVAGVLHVSGAGVADGYAGRPGLTAERFVADPFRPGGRLWRTGDQARWGSDGELEYLGRADRQVKVDGRRIELAGIEAVLARHPDVSQAAAVTGQDQAGDTSIIAYVVLSAQAAAAGQGAAAAGAAVAGAAVAGAAAAGAAGAGAAGTGAAGTGAAGAVARLSAHAGRWLPGYMVPVEIVPIPRMPLLPGGGVDYQGLSAPLADRAAGQDGAEEEVLRAAFGEVLGLGEVGVHDNFFALGGHSLMAMSLLMIIQDKLGAALAVSDVFEAPTPAELALKVRG